MAVSSAVGAGLKAAKGTMKSLGTGIKAAANSEAGSGIISRAVGSAAIGGVGGAGLSAARGEDMWEGAKRGAIIGGGASLGKSAYTGEFGKAMGTGKLSGAVGQTRLFDDKQFKGSDTGNIFAGKANAKRMDAGNKAIAARDQAASAARQASTNKQMSIFGHAGGSTAGLSGSLKQGRMSGGAAKDVQTLARFGQNSKLSNNVVNNGQMSLF